MERHMGVFAIHVRLASPLISVCPVRVEADLSAMLRKAGLPSAVDEQSLRLWEVGKAGRRPVDVQFMPKERPWQGDGYHAIEDTHSSGTLCWQLSPSPDIERLFELEASLPVGARWLSHFFGAHPWRIAAGESCRITPLFAHMEIAPHHGERCETAVTMDGKPFFTYCYGPQLFKPYIYPLYGPSGVVLTDLGMGGDPALTHRHHHSLWIGHKCVSGVNFWEEDENCGRIVHQRFERMESGPVFASLSENNTWQDAQGKPVLLENRIITAYAFDEGEPRLMDLTLTMRAPEGKEAIIGQEKFGFIALRVKENMIPLDGGGTISNAQGDQGEIQTLWKPSRWCDLSGPATAREWNGAALLESPDNIGAPHRWHTRDNGFYCASFTADAPIVLRGADVLTMRYRLVLHAGDAHEGEVEAHWQSYAARPEIMIDLPREDARGR